MHSEFQRAWTMPIRSDEAFGKDVGGAEGPLKVNLDELAAVGGDILECLVGSVVVVSLWSDLGQLSIEPTLRGRCTASFGLESSTAHTSSL